MSDRPAATTTARDVLIIQRTKVRRAFDRFSEKVSQLKEDENLLDLQISEIEKLTLDLEKSKK